MTGKIRILMESNATPPMAQYSIETKTMDSTATHMSSLESRMSYSACPPLPAKCRMVQGYASARRPPTHEPNKMNPTELYLDYTPECSEDESSPPQSQDSSVSVRMDYNNDEIHQSQELEAPWGVEQNLDNINKENILSYNKTAWSEENKPQQKV
jgi:hypothetical protein